MSYKSVEINECVCTRRGNITRRWRNSGRVSIWGAAVFGVFLLAANFAAAQTPSPALLVLEKSDNSQAIVDPANLQIVARVPAGPDPHEIVASADGKPAYISKYGGSARGAEHNSLGRPPRPESAPPHP